MFVCVVADLCVAEGHVLTQSVDVLLTGVVQLRVQTDVLRLQVHEGFSGFTENTDTKKNTETFNLCRREKKKRRSTEGNIISR